MNEFKKKKYERRFPTHDERHNELLEYLRADDVDRLLEHAHKCNMSRRHGDFQSQDTSLSYESNDSYISSQPIVSNKKDSKKSSSKHRKAHKGSSGGDRSALHHKKSRARLAPRHVHAYAAVATSRAAACRLS